ncbi:MAG: hypothetical protein WCP41_06580 [Verrucomicrobiota bacterium]
MELRQTPFIAALFATAVFLSGSQLFAGASNKSGNPFGNGSQYGNDGTFSAIIRGADLTGVTQFSTYGGSGSVTTGLLRNTNVTGGTNAANVPGQASIFLQGQAYRAITTAVIDSAANEISAVFSQITGIPYNTQNGATVVTITNSGTNVVTGGAFIANLKNSFPNQTFSGTGSIGWASNVTNPLYVLQSNTVTTTNYTITTNVDINNLVTSSVTIIGGFTNKVIYQIQTNITTNPGPPITITTNYVTNTFTNYYGGLTNSNTLTATNIVTNAIPSNKTTVTLVPNTNSRVLIPFTVTGLRINSSSATYY